MHAANIGILNAGWFEKVIRRHEVPYFLYDVIK
jgi:hypothetical protein